MFNRYYQEELANLKDLGAGFSKSHPALAHMLKGPSQDPDVERLLQGVAFLTGLLRQKLDDEFPEIIHEMIQLIWPHYLRPTPSSTIIEFSPKPTLKQPIAIQKNIHVASPPVDGTPCLFRTCYDVEVNPLKLVDAQFVEVSGQPPSIRLMFEISGIKLEEWKPEKLRLFLAGDFSSSSDLYFLLRHHLKRIGIKAEGPTQECVLSPDHLKPVGFELHQELIPYPTHSFPGYRVLQEYFILPEKFLFLDLTGWEKWRDREDAVRFEVRFELADPPFRPTRLRRDNFVLSATPAINIFPHEADPVRLDHKKTEYPVRPSGTEPSHYQVYSIEKVVGYTHGTAQEREYSSFDLFTPEPESGPVYHVTLKSSPVRAETSFYLSVAYPKEYGAPMSETLSIDLMCTNGFLPEGVRMGDISQPTSSTPEFVDFSNITPPTTSILPPLGSNLLWRLLSHLSLNYVSLAKAENLRALLELYVFEKGRDRTLALANKRRIAGLEKLETKPADRLVSGILMRGREIMLSARNDHFASQGDLYLFGCVLDYFLGAYASMNSFTILKLKEVLRGDLYQWPPRIGERPLI